MENIILTFTGQTNVICINQPTVILTLDETGKHIAIDGINNMEIVVPKRILSAFNYAAVSKIIAKDTIAENNKLMVLDGYIYTITITKGVVIKEYSANDLSVETYPLLRFIASWYRKIVA